MSENDLLNFDDKEAWARFVIRRRVANRFVLNAKENNFITFLIKSALQREINLSKGISLFRARLGNDYSEDNILEKIPYKASEMGPPCEIPLLKQGRANADGIAVLYLADSSDTAIAETRPWAGGYITVGEAKLVRNVKLVDMTKEIDDHSIENHIWKKINESFAKPTDPNYPVWDYCHTQYLSEVFKQQKYDGLRYKSALNQVGFNVVLFNIKSAEFIKTELHQLKKIKYITTRCT